MADEDTAKPTIPKQDQLPEFEPAKESRRILMGYLKMEPDFIALNTKLKGGKLEEALKYVLDDMSTKKQYGNSLSKIRDHPAGLIENVLKVHNDRYDAIDDAFDTTADQFHDFAGAANISRTQWRKMCGNLEGFMTQVRNQLASMEQTALSYMGAVFALGTVQEKFQEEYGDMERAGADGKSASIRQDKLVGTVKTLVQDAENVRNQLLEFYDQTYQEACQHGERPACPLGIKRPVDPEEITRFGIKDNIPVLDLLKDVLTEYDKKLK